MSHPSRWTAETGAGRRALRAAVWRASAALTVTAGLVAAVDAGARILGPALIVVGSYGGAKALREWWRHLDEEWFLAEVALVSIGWALLAGAFAAAQYVVFSVVPRSFYVDANYARLVSPGYRAAWARDSSRAAAALSGVDQAAQGLAGGPASLALDSLYPLGGHASVHLSERCEYQLPLERCPWLVTVLTAPGAKPVEVALPPPEGERRTLAGAKLQQRLQEEMARLRGELADYGRHLADPAAFVQPGIVDFLYDTSVAFSGNDAGVFVPISVLARICKVVEFLASLLLFGIVVSRISTAAGARTAQRAGR